MAFEIDELAAVEYKLGWYIYGKLNETRNREDSSIITSMNEKTRNCVRIFSKTILRN